MVSRDKKATHATNSFDVSREAIDQNFVSKVFQDPYFGKCLFFVTLYLVVDRCFTKSCSITAHGHGRGRV